MCTLFSSLQNLSKKTRKEEWTVRFEEAKSHIKFVVSLYEEQWANGRLFLHEHPATATLWDLEEIKELEKKAGVLVHRADQCMYGLETRGSQGEAMLAKKPTKFMANPLEIGLELQRRCNGEHEYQDLTGGRAKWAASSPVGL